MKVVQLVEILKGEDTQTLHCDVIFQVLTAASMMFRAVFWVVLPCKRLSTDVSDTHL
jgi:hypothetical protein